MMVLISNFSPINIILKIGAVIGTINIKELALDGPNLVVAIK